MDSELDYVAPVRIATRKKAPIAPGDVEIETGEPEPFYVLAFDPGGTTGWAVFGVWPEAMADPAQKLLSNVAFWSAGEFTGDEDGQVDSMLGLVEAWPEESDIAVEDFILRQFTMARDLLAPVRVTAAFQYGLRSLRPGNPRTYTRQQPSLAMRSVTDERLKAWGFWAPLKGLPHARDAVKHAVTRLRLLKDQFMKESRRAEVPGDQAESEE